MLNSLLRLLLVLWVLGYLVVSCGGLFSGSAGAAAGGLLAGTVLLVPWLVGVLVLAIVIWLTNPRGAR